eukprot:3218983-Alexandrium_andersonii.AAC.1
MGFPAFADPKTSTRQRRPAGLAGATASSGWCSALGSVLQLSGLSRFLPGGVYCLPGPPEKVPPVPLHRRHSWG